MIKTDLSKIINAFNTCFSPFEVEIKKLFNKKVHTLSLKDYSTHKNANIKTINDDSN